MSVTVIRLPMVSCVCDFDYSRFVNEKGEHVRCEITLSQGVEKSLIEEIIERVIRYLSATYRVDLKKYIDVVTNELIEVRIYAELFKAGVSIYEVIHKLCTLIDYELYKRSGGVT